MVLATESISWTHPNNCGLLPPVAVRNLRAAQFQPSVVCARGDFIPTAVHSLASHRAYTHWFTLAGQHETPTSFAMRTRMLDCVNFDDNPSIIGAANGLRFGRHGVSIMHFGRVDAVAQLAAGSTGANIHLDFGTRAVPPPPPACTSYLTCSVLFKACSPLRTPSDLKNSRVLSTGSASSPWQPWTPTRATTPSAYKTLSMRSTTTSALRTCIWRATRLCGGETFQPRRTGLNSGQ
jgi:hypothetical protein